MIFFFDTETTGLTRPKSGYDAQPFILQLAGVLWDEKEREIVNEFSFIIDPPEWDAKKYQGAINVHKITMEKCEAAGIDEDLAFEILAAMFARADFIVAHNIDFDLLVVRALAWRCHDSELPKKPTLCTMRIATPVCNIPGKFGKPKWPKLSEAYEHFTGEELVGAHDALVDVKACMTVYEHLKAGGHIK